MKNLHELATQYAEKHFPISKVSTFNTIKHDIAFHSFCDGFNEAMRMFTQIDKCPQLVPCHMDGTCEGNACFDIVSEYQEKK